VPRKVAAAGLFGNLMTARSDNFPAYLLHMRRQRAHRRLIRPPAAEPFSDGDVRVVESSAGFFAAQLLQDKKIAGIELRLKATSSKI
jgi:hypothetical protein